MYTNDSYIASYLILSHCSESDHSAVTSGYESDTSHGKIIPIAIAIYMICVVYFVTLLYVCVCLLYL